MNQNQTQDIKTVVESFNRYQIMSKHLIEFQPLFFFDVIPLLFFLFQNKKNKL